jgi:hypothetical protein
MQGGFEAKAIKSFILSEIFAVIRIVLAFGAPQPDPPLVPGGIDGFRSL